MVFMSLLVFRLMRMYLPYACLFNVVSNKTGQKSSAFVQKNLFMFENWMGMCLPHYQARLQSWTCHS